MATPVSPYRSLGPTDPRVHHIFSDCPEGRRIVPLDLVPGTGGYPLCEICQGMRA